MQNFKGDAEELKFINASLPAIELIGLQKDLFLESAYQCGPLGDMIWESGRSPLSNAIKQEIFRDSFKEIFDAFVVAGTFESYVSVFQKIFGEDVEITFTVPAPGKLIIDILAAGIELSRFVARTIEDNAYVYSPVITQDEDQIVFQTIKGFKSQYELEQMLYEMVPAGVFTEINLDLL